MNNNLTQPLTQPLTQQQENFIEKLKNIKGAYLGNDYLEESCKLFNVVSNYDENNIQPASIDLRLSKKLVKNNSNKLIVDPYNKEDISPEIIDISDNGYNLEPNEFILGASIELIDLRYINTILLKHNIALEITAKGKSSIARLGLVVENAAYIDAGFIGSITLEIYNQEKFSVRLHHNMPICQIRVSLVTGISKLYNGKYLHQILPTSSRYYLNKRSFE